MAAVTPLTPRMRALVVEVRERWQFLDQRIAALDAEFAEQARSDESARRLTTIPGIGALNATALVAAIGDVATFARGRDLAAWLGLVPRQVTTGGRPKLVGITKRGSKYLRKTLIQGARAALPTLRQSETLLGQWLRGLLARAHVNTAVVALAASGTPVPPPAPVQARPPRSTGSGRPSGPSRHRGASGSSGSSGGYRGTRTQGRPAGSGTSGSGSSGRPPAGRVASKFPRISGK